MTGTCECDNEPSVTQNANICFANSAIEMSGAIWVHVRFPNFQHYMEKKNWLHASANLPPSIMCLVSTGQDAVWTLSRAESGEEEQTTGNR